jgi:hypothetical protein
VLLRYEITISESNSMNRQDSFIRILMLRGLLTALLLVATGIGAVLAMPGGATIMDADRDGFRGEVGNRTVSTDIPPSEARSAEASAQGGMAQQGLAIPGRQLTISDLREKILRHRLML